MNARLQWDGAKRLPLLAAGLLLGACTVIPTGPSVMAMPGSRKTMEQYQVDVLQCQRYADTVIAAASGSAANADNAAAATAAAGAAVGAAAGAIIGAATGQAGQGAAIGAGTGLLFGGASGSYYTGMSSYQLQRGYDSAYLQCMYARGHQVPVPRGYAYGRGTAGQGTSAQPTTAQSTYPAPPRYPPPNMPPPPLSSQAPGTAPQGSAGAAPVAPAAPQGGYGPPPNVSSSSFPPPNAPPPANLPAGN